MTASFVESVAVKQSRSSQTGMASHFTSISLIAVNGGVCNSVVPIAGTIDADAVHTVVAWI